MSALFNASGGSLLLPILMHFQLNSPLLPEAQPYDAITYLLAALAVVWIHRGRMLDRSTAVTEILPGTTPGGTPPPASRNC